MSILNKQKSYEMASSRAIEAQIVAGAKGSSAIQSDATNVASRLSDLLDRVKSDELAAALLAPYDMVLDVISIVLAKGYGVLTPIQSVLAQSGVPLEIIAATGFSSKCIKLVNTGESIYLTSLIENEEVDMSIQMASKPLPSSIPLKAITEKNHNAYRLDVGYRSLLGNKHQRVENAPYWALNYLSGIAYSIEDAQHALRPMGTMKTNSPSQAAMEAFEYNQNLHIHGSALAVNSLIEQGNKFYFPHSFCGHLRMYSSGFAINLQGQEWDKSLLEFSKKEQLTESGLKWLKIGIANAYGLDKDTLQERLLWVSINPDLESLTPKADDPLIYAKLVRALRANTTGAMVAIDATASGAQLIGALTGCTKSLIVSNVLPNEAHERIDLYTQITEWIGSTKYPRKLVKQATVPAFYGSVKEPENVFEEQVDLFWSAMSNLKGVYWFLTQLPKLWHSGISEYSFTLPDGQVIHKCITGTVHETVNLELTGLEVVLSETIIGRKKKFKGFLPAIIHSLDGMVMRNIISKCKSAGIDIMCIHDSFSVHPNNCAQVLEWYKQQLAQLVVDNPLPRILTEIFGHSLAMPDFSEGLTRSEIANLIAESEYALT